MYCYRTMHLATDDNFSCVPKTVCLGQLNFQAFQQIRCPSGGKCNVTTQMYQGRLDYNKSEAYLFHFK